MAAAYAVDWMVWAWSVATGGANATGSLKVNWVSSGAETG